MSEIVELVDNEVVITAGGLSTRLSVSLAQKVAAALPNKPAPGALGPLVLPEDHAMWDHHSGGDRHNGEPWMLPEAVDDARSTRRYLPAKASAVFELLLSEPGRLFTSEEIVKAVGSLKSAAAVAGSLNGFVKPKKQNGRPFPFYWWEGADGKPTRFAVRPSVAKVFIAAGD
jgi:hypothetical protein